MAGKNDRPQGESQGQAGTLSEPPDSGVDGEAADEESSPDAAEAATAPLPWRAVETPIPSEAPSQRRHEEETSSTGVRSFPEELRAQAAKTPSGWVYEVDPAFDRSGPIPPERIRAAWKIDDTGSPTAHFVANPHYRPGAPTIKRSPRRAPRRRLVLAAGAVAVAAIAAAVVVLLASGTRHHQSVGSSSNPQATGVNSHAPTAPTISTRRPGGNHRPRAPKPPARPRPAVVVKPPGVGLTLTATDSVWVCLEDQSGRRLINGQTMTPGETNAYRAGSFRLFLGHSGVKLRIDGRERAVPANPDPVGFRVAPGGLRPLPAGIQPPCG